jgi:hypothetical protein
VGCIIATNVARLELVGGGRRVRCDPEGDVHVDTRDRDAVVVVVIVPIADRDPVYDLDRPCSALPNGIGPPQGHDFGY